MSNFNAVDARSFDGVAKGVGSHSAAFSHYCNLGLLVGNDSNGKLVSECVVAQAHQCFVNLKNVIEKSGHSISDAVRVSIFLVDMRDYKAVEAEFLAVFANCLPTLSVVGVKALPKGAKVGVDGLLTHGLGTIPNAPQAGDLIKLTNNSKKAPVTSNSTQLVAFSHYSNVSCQLPIDPSVNRIVAECVGAQAAQCFKNVSAALTGIGVGLDDVVKVTIFVRDLADMEVINTIYKCFFPRSAIARAVNYFPARTVVKVSSLPHNARVAVEVSVAHGDGTPPQLIEDRHGIVIIAKNNAKAPKCALSSQSVAFSHYNHLSAQLPLNENGDVVGKDTAAQVAQVFANIKAIVENCGHKMNELVKVNAYLANIEDESVFNAEFEKVFGNGVKPALRLVGVGELAKGAKVMADAILSNPEGTPPAK